MSPKTVKQPVRSFLSFGSTQPETRGHMIINEKILLALTDSGELMDISVSTCTIVCILYEH